MRECRAFAEKNNIVLLGTYVDRTFSARSDTTGEMASDIPVLGKQLADTERGIGNMLNALQQGVLTSTTKERLEALEEQLDLLKLYSHTTTKTAIKLLH